MLPAIVATDLDGTLLRPDLSVSRFTRRVLQQLEDHGVQIIFVTARPPRWMAPLEQIAPAHGRAIRLNGALMWNFTTHTATRIRGFTHGEVQRIVTDLREAIPGIALGAERHTGVVFDPHFVSQHPHGPHTRWAFIETMVDVPVGKLLAQAPHLDDTTFFTQVHNVLDDRALLAFSGAGGLAEMTAPGVTKAAALAQWAADHNVPASQVIAFGDMPNDLPMLTWAGTGIAVANAHPDVLHHADGHALAHHDDGVARYLAELYNLHV